MATRTASSRWQHSTASQHCLVIFNLLTLVGWPHTLLFTAHSSADPTTREVKADTILPSFTCFQVHVVSDITMF